MCLECGSRVALGYRRPPDWRVPAAIVAGVLLLAVAGAAIALDKVGDEADREVSSTPIKLEEREKESAAQKQKAAKGESRPATKKPEAKKEPEAKKPATERQAPAAPATGTALVKRGILYDWPPELKAFTVVLLSAEDRASAERFARSASKGMPAKIGVIRADDFESLPKGFYIVFAGSYEDRATADKAVARLGKRFSGAFPQLVER